MEGSHMKRTQFLCILSCLLLNQVMIGAASSSMLAKGDIILNGDNDSVARLPRMHTQYTELFHNLTCQFSQDNNIPLAGKSQKELDAMVRLLSLRSATASSKHLHELISRDEQLNILSGDELHELVKFGDYVGCDQVIMKALTTLYTPHYIENVLGKNNEPTRGIIPHVDADNAKLLLKDLAKRMSSLISSRIGIQSKVLENPNDEIISTALSPKGNMVISGSDNGIVQMWDMTTGKCLHTLQHGTAEKAKRRKVYTVAVNTEGTMFASGLADGTVRVWTLANIDSPKILRGHIKGIESLCFSPDGKRLASTDNRTVRLWDTTTGSFVQLLNGHEEEGSATKIDIAFSADSAIMALRLHNSVLLYNMKTNRLMHILNTEGFANSITFSPDGTTLATTTASGAIMLWDVATGQDKNLLIGHKLGEPVYCVAFSPDGKILASSSRDKTVRIWDLATRYSKKEIPSATAVEKLTFSPDGKTLALITPFRVVQLRNVPTGHCKSQLIGHEKRIYGLNFASNGEILSSASYDGKVYLWQLDYQKDMQKNN